MKKVFALLGIVLLMVGCTTVSIEPRHDVSLSSEGQSLLVGSLMQAASNLKLDSYLGSGQGIVVQVSAGLANVGGATTAGVNPHLEQDVVAVLAMVYHVKNIQFSAVQGAYPEVLSIHLLVYGLKEVDTHFLGFASTSEEADTMFVATLTHGDTVVAAMTATGHADQE